MQFDKVKAGVLQLTRPPGKNVVHFGSLLRTLGVFFCSTCASAGCGCASGRVCALLAMSSAKHTIDFEKEFNLHAQALDTLVK